MTCPQDNQDKVTQYLAFKELGQVHSDYAVNYSTTSEINDLYTFQVWVIDEMDK